MARSYFCDHCNHAMAKGGRVTLNIAVNEPHKAPFPLSFTKELCPLCYENLMAAMPELLSKPNQVSAARLVPQLPTTTGNDGQVIGRVEARHSSAMPGKDWVDETLMRLRGK
jgi:hypothetical protein